MQQNLDTIQKVYEAIAAGDGEAAHSLSDPQIEIRQSEELPWGGVYHGLADAMRFFHLVSSYLNSKVTVERFVDAGEQVAVIGRTEGTVRENGNSFCVPLVHLWGFRDGRIVSLTVLLDNQAMLSALADKLG